MECSNSGKSFIIHVSVSNWSLLKYSTIFGGSNLSEKRLNHNKKQFFSDPYPSLRVLPIGCAIRFEQVFYQ